MMSSQTKQKRHWPTGHKDGVRKKFEGVPTRKQCVREIHTVKTRNILVRTTFGQRQRTLNNYNIVAQIRT